MSCTTPPPPTPPPPPTTTTTRFNSNRNAFSYMSMLIIHCLAPHFFMHGWLPHPLLLISKHADWPSLSLIDLWITTCTGIGVSVSLPDCLCFQLMKRLLLVFLMSLQNRQALNTPRAVYVRTDQILSGWGFGEMEGGVIQVCYVEKSLGCVCGGGVVTQF